MIPLQLLSWDILTGFLKSSMKSLWSTIYTIFLVQQRWVKRCLYLYLRFKVVDAHDCNLHYFDYVEYNHTC